MSAERIIWLVLFPILLLFAQQHRWVMCIICVILSSLVLIFRDTLGTIRIRALYRARQDEQWALDDEAEEYLKTLKSGSPAKRRPLILFLRSFSSDRELHASSLFAPDGYDPMPLETRLAAGFGGRFTAASFAPRMTGSDVWGDAFAKMPFEITVSHPDFSEYVGRLFYSRPGEITIADADWIDEFRLLAEYASLIVSVPIDASPAPEPSATILELLELRANNLLERCVFVMPPEQEVWLWRPDDETSRRRGKGQFWSPRPRKLSALWKATRTKLARDNFELPAFRDTPDGATLFTIRGGKCEITLVTCGDLSNPRRYLKALGMILPGCVI